MPQPLRKFGPSGHRPPDGRWGSHNQQGTQSGPLYARTGAVSSALSAHNNRCDSWNLFLDKFSFSFWEDGIEDKKRSLKTEALHAVVENYKNASSSLNGFIKSRNQLFQSLEHQHGDRFATLRLVNSSRLLLHLGRSNVLENVGLYCDHTTGLPLIPGTALKGVLSTWACWEANQNADGTFPEADQWTIERKDLHRRIFGDNAKNGSGSAGEIVFLGGFPTSPPKLELDILTPHPDEGRGRITPNLFLSIAQGTIWNFGFLALNPRSRDDLPSVLCLAEECLSCNGLGAKTSSGYGQFRPLSDQEEATLAKERDEALAARHAAEKEAAEKARLQSLSPEERAYCEYVARQKDWTSAAREIESREEKEKQWILKYFRSEPGKALLKTWTNPKGLARIETLKKAGL